MKKRLILFLIGIVAVAAGRGLFFYEGFYSGPKTASQGPGTFISTELTPAEPTDTPSGEIKGRVLIDAAHDNDFGAGELNVLVYRLISRGLTVRFTESSADLKKELLGKSDDKTISPTLATGKDEPPAIALVVICPKDAFTTEERKTVREFLDKGGRLLLISDPTRWGEINSVSLDYGLVFESDYLYNMKENETNYRNIYVRDFKENEITKNLKSVVLYTSGSITSKSSGIAFTDDNTLSSAIETRKKLSPIALNDNILAVHDLTFMIEPQNGMADNNQLILNIAGWLANASPKQEPTPTPTPTPSPSPSPSPTSSPTPK